jgi:class III poly(R)-hydroxyalkanoic acid synthase PhaE subunit
MGGSAAANANPFASMQSTAWGKTPWGTDWSAMFTPQFQGPSADVAHKYFGFFEQYVGASRAFAELIAKISANPDPSARAQEFTAGLTALQQPFAKMWQSMVSEQSGAAMPALGLTREHQEANERLRKLFTDLQQQQLTLSSMWNDIIAEGLRAFGEKAGAKLRAGESFSSIKAVYDLWIECAELAYAKAAHGPAYAKAQADLGNTMAHLRIEQRKQVEAISKQLDLPTRDELNTVHHRLKDLKAEVRALQAQLRAATAAANAGAGAANTTVKKKSAAKGTP